MKITDLLKKESIALDVKRTITALLTSKYRIKVGVINIPTLDVPIFHLCYISSRLSNCCYP